MNSFVEAVKNVPVETRTRNGMKTYNSSKSDLVDLFFSIGASRGKDLSAQFSRAVQENDTLALRLLMWARDVREGAGEREVVRLILKSLEKTNSTLLTRVMPFLPEYGRWDDLLVFETPAARVRAFELIASALKSGNGLCAKWCPRKGKTAVELRQYMGLSPKSYRKLLVSLTRVVETQMCANQWTEINYSHVPSLAAARYQSAFKRHDPQGYENYKSNLAQGTAKINAAAVYPYDVIKNYVNNRGGDAAVVQAQWDALPNYVGDQLILPLVDVSGSMTSPISGNPNLTCMMVAVSLGLYLSDKNQGPFKDMFLTFSESSRLEILRGNLIEKIDQMSMSKWGMSTNLESAFDSILNYATQWKVPEKHMPKFLLILSDMEFDYACDDLSALEMIQTRYQQCGYQMPKIVFWNLHARKGNVPVKFDQNGVALVSGFSPAIMKSILLTQDFNPQSIMLETLNSPRYEAIQ